MNKYRVWIADQEGEIIEASTGLEARKEFARKRGMLDTFAVKSIKINEDKSLIVTIRE
jgi:hypothetical protein